MRNDLLLQMSTLLSKWNEIASHCEASQKLGNEFSLEQRAYLAGVVLGIEIAREDLVDSLAKPVNEAPNLFLS